MTGEPMKKDRGWRDDEFARHEVFAQVWQLAPLGLLLILSLPPWPKFAAMFALLCSLLWKRRRKP